MGLLIRTRRNCLKLSVAIAAVLCTMFGVEAKAYDLRINNETAYFAQGRVNYIACKADAFQVAPGAIWSSSSRGACLISSIESTLRPASAGQQAPAVTRYSSSGTSYSDFSIKQSGTSFRVWSAAELAKVGETLAAPSGPVAQWQAVASGATPPQTAFKGGRQRMGGRVDSAGKPVYDLLPVCRSQLSNGTYVVGNAAPFYRHNGGWSWNELRCYVYIDNKESEIAAYEVLMIDPQIMIRSPNAVRWVAGKNGAVPADAFDAGKAAPATRVCRAEYSDGEVWVRVGTMGQDGCYFPYGGQLRRAENYEVLAIESAMVQQLAARGVDEPRLASEPDRPPRVGQAGENCSAPNGNCKAREKEVSAIGAYKINAVRITDANGRETSVYKKTKGGIWEARYPADRPNSMRRFVEVERNDNAIILYSGAHDFGGTNGKAPAQTVVLGVNYGQVKAGGLDLLLQGADIHWLVSDPKFRDGFKWVGTTARMSTAMRAEPDTALALAFKPVNAKQVSSFWKRTTLTQLIKGKDGGFGNYKVASSGDGWLELYSVISPQTAGAGKWNVHFLKVDFWRNRVWELLGVTDRQPNAQDVPALRELAKTTGSSKAWAEAYELTEAPIFSGEDMGAVLGRLSGTQQIGWTLREEIGGTTLRWEELKSDVVAQKTQTNEGAPVGRMVTEVSRNAHSLTLSGSELGSPLVIDWTTGAVTANGKKVADFLTGEAEYFGQRKKLPRPTAPGMSPGFMFVNKTDWPVLVKIGQVGCLYHGVVQPHSTMTRDTGAVWFELSASWAVDGKDLSKEQIFTDCVAPVYFTTLGVIAAAATGGSAAGVVALGVSGAATSGAASTAVSFMKAGGSSQLAQDAMAAGIFVVAAAASGGVAAFQVASTRVLPGATVAATRSTLAATVAKGAAKEALASMEDEAKNYALFSVASIFEPSEKEMGVLESWFDKEITLAGQYAGYPWPWKHKDRVMPQYEISGGPRIDTLKDGSKLIRKGAKFKFERVN